MDHRVARATALGKERLPLARERRPQCNQARVPQTGGTACWR